MGVFYGTNGADTLNGGLEADLLYGLGGFDVLDGGDGNDTLDGGAGQLDPVNDTLMGGEGDDEILSNGGFETYDVLAGGAGIDTLHVMGSAYLSLSTLSGFEKLILESTPTDGAFILMTAGQAGTAFSADLHVTGATGHTRIQIQGDGNSVDLSGWTFANWDDNDVLTLDGAAGDQSLVGSSRIDSLDGGDGNDTIRGGGGSFDILSGDAGDDHLYGGAGDDWLSGGGGGDIAYIEGARSQFKIWSYEKFGSIGAILTDQAGSLATDHLQSVETVSFSDRSMKFYGIQQNHLAVMDGSRFDDVLIRSASTGQIGFVDMSGQSTDAQGVVRAVTGALPSGWTALASGDFDWDGQADVIVQGPTGGLFFVNTASGAPVWGELGANLPSEWQVVGLGDMTLDGTLDLVIRSSVSGNLMYAEMNGTTFSGWGNVFNMGTAWRAVDVGDYDRDGDSDVLVQEIATGTTYFVQMQGGAFSGWGLVTGGPGSQWVAKETADLNGDGYFDVVFQNNGTGQIWAVNMAGGVNAGWITLTTALGWNVAGSGDYDNDGYADILVQSPSSGDLYYINVDNGAMVGWGNVKNGLGTDWIAV